MNIVILDGYTTNPGDVSWDELAQRGQLTCYDYNDPGELVSRAADAEILINNKCVFTREVLQQLPKLKYIGLLSTGFNTIDIDAARELGIVVSNVPAYSTGLVAQHTFALILERFNHVALHARSVRDGQWSTGRNFCYWNAPLSELQGKT